MPQIKAAKKDLRVNARRRAVNDRWRRKVRLLTREFKAVIASAKKADAASLLVKLQSALDRSARHRLISKNKSSRLKSQFSQAVAKLK